jgi:hypothetical protein
MDNKNQLIHKIIRLPKDESAFLYFQLESNEGLCFYSTLDQSLKEPYRDIEIFGHQSLKEQIDHFFYSIQKSLNIEIVLDEIIDDSTKAVQQYDKKGKKHMRLNEK